MGFPRTISLLPVPLNAGQLVLSPTRTYAPSGARREHRFPVGSEFGVLSRTPLSPPPPHRNPENVPSSGVIDERQSMDYRCFGAFDNKSIFPVPIATYPL